MSKVVDAFTVTSVSYTHLDNVRKLVHHFICFPDDSSENICSGKESGYAAYKGGAARIEDVFFEYLSGAVSESFENTYLCTLFFDHAAHGRHTYEGGDKEEKQRKDLREPLYYTCIVIKTYITHIGFSVQSVTVRVIHIIYLIFCVFELGAGVFEFSFAVIKFSPAFYELGAGVREFCLSIGYFPFTAFKLCFGFSKSLRGFI